jgi:hypothetical protein
MLLFDWTYLYNLNLKTDDTLKARFYHAVNLQIGHGLQNQNSASPSKSVTAKTKLAPGW